MTEQWHTTMSTSPKECTHTNHCTTRWHPNEKKHTHNINYKTIHHHDFIHQQRVQMAMPLWPLWQQNIGNAQHRAHSIGRPAHLFHHPARRLDCDLQRSVPMHWSNATSQIQVAPSIGPHLHHHRGRVDAYVWHTLSTASPKNHQKSAPQACVASAKWIKNKHRSDKEEGDYEQRNLANTYSFAYDPTRMHKVRPTQQKWKQQNTKKGAQLLLFSNLILVHQTNVPYIKQKRFFSIGAQASLTLILGPTQPQS